MNDLPDKPHPMAEAMEWVARIFSVVIVMVAPGLAGQWLDQRLGTSFLVLVGFILGLTFGLWYLLTMTKVVSKKQTKGHRDEDNKQ